MEEKPRKRSLFKSSLVILAAILMIAMFTSSVVCAAFVYRTWSRSVVKVHRGPNAPQRRYTHLDNEQKARIHALLAGAAGSAVVGVGILALLKGHVSNSP